MPNDLRMCMSHIVLNTVYEHVYIPCRNKAEVDDYCEPCFNRYEEEILMHVP